jgi:hypothetical protein
MDSGKRGNKRGPFKGAGESQPRSVHSHELKRLQQEIGAYCFKFAVRHKIESHDVTFWDDSKGRWFDVEFKGGVELRGIPYTAKLEDIKVPLDACLTSYL